MSRNSCVGWWADVAQMSRRCRARVVSHVAQELGRMVGRCRADVAQELGRMVGRWWADVAQELCRMVGDMVWRYEKERSGMLVGMFRNVRRHSVCIVCTWGMRGVPAS
jgi:hypothetical protein